MKKELKLEFETIEASMDKMMAKFSMDSELSAYGNCNCNCNCNGGNCNCNCNCGF